MKKRCGGFSFNHKPHETRENRILKPLTLTLKPFAHLKLETENLKLCNLTGLFSAKSLLLEA